VHAAVDDRQPPCGAFWSVHVACVRASVLIRHVDDRPHRVSPGFFPINNAYISGTTRANFVNFLCMMLMFMARSSADIFTIGRIAYRLKGVFFPVENALSAGKGGWECAARAKYAIALLILCSNSNITVSSVKVKVHIFIHSLVQTVQIVNSRLQDRTTRQ